MATGSRTARSEEGQIVEEGVRRVRHRQAVALMLGLVVIFAVAMVAGGGPGAQPGGVSGFSEVRTAAYTVVAGVIIFVFGQIAQRFFIEPIQEQKKVLGEVTLLEGTWALVSLWGIVQILRGKPPETAAH